jgi:hypothetical protein
MTYTGGNGTTSDSITVKTVNIDGSPPVSKTHRGHGAGVGRHASGDGAGRVRFTGANAVSITDDRVNGETLTVTITAGT